jgi:3,4-dihydroxy 2-butanone 4-phosphate synthase/GTP cyclohydrolase II
MSAVTALKDDWFDDAGLVLDPVERAIADIAAGRPVVVVDDENRENEGDLIVAAEKITAETVAFMMTECRGLICVPMEPTELDRLGLPQMVDANTESMRTAFTVSVDASAAHGVSTGISAADRATTIRLLTEPSAVAADFVRPGHVFPLRARPGGVLVRAGHTEAGVDLARLAGLRPAAAIVEIAREDGTMARLPELVPFARKHGLSIISIEDLIAYRRSSEPTVHREAVTTLPTAFGDFRAYGYRSTADGVEHIALVAGEIGDGADVLVRVHSECLTGDVFGSQRCDCGPQLQAALRRGGPGSGAVSARPRGPRHRPDVQAAGVRTPGARPGHPGRQPGARTARRRPRLRRRRADPHRSRGALAAADDQQPGQDRRAGQTRPRRAQPGADAGGRGRAQSAVSADQAGPDGPRPALAGRRRPRRRLRQPVNAGHPNTRSTENEAHRTRETGK